MTSLPLKRASAQIRADHPEAPERPHPTAIRLARSAALIAGAGNGVGFYELAAIGFSIDEIVEHAAAAEKILNPERNR